MNAHPLLEGHHITYEKDGDILMFSRRQWNRVPAGTSGQVLQIGSDGLPAWVSEPAVSITAITTLLSATFAIDSTGVKTVTTAHGLSVTPNLQDVQATISESSNVDDFAVGYVKVESTDATNVVLKVNVTTASATGGAVATLNVLVITGV